LTTTIDIPRDNAAQGSVDLAERMFDVAIAAIAALEAIEQMPAIGSARSL
jgi:hypothetical protein